MASKKTRAISTSVRALGKEEARKQFVNFMDGVDPLRGGNKTRMQHLEEKLYNLAMDDGDTAVAMFLATQLLGKAPQSVTVERGPQSASLEEMRLRIEAKILELRSQQGAITVPAAPVISLPAPESVVEEPET